MPGSTKVTASCGNKSVSCDITVSSDTSPSSLEKSHTMKAGAVKVKNGVLYANKVSKKDKKTGEYIPDTITVKCGKVTETVKMMH
jgi:hypothetical protein